MTIIAGVGSSEIAEPPTPHHRRVPGEEGAWVFILGDMCVFAVFFCVYLLHRGEHAELFAHAASRASVVAVISSSAH